MRAFLWLIVLAIGGAIGYAFYAGWISVGVTGSVCQHDDEIEASWREEPEKQAAAFIAAFSDGDTKAAYNRLNDMLKAKVTYEQFDDIAKGVRGSGPFSSAKLEHVYRPRSAGAEDDVICKLSGPDGSVRVRAVPLKTQAHLVYSTATRNNDWAWTLWLIENDGPWEVASFNLNPSSLAGHYTRDLVKMAEAQDAKGHRFNAHMLYVAAAFVGNRGNEVQLGISQDAQEAVRNNPAPGELAGNPPFAWTYDGTAFSVELVQITAVAKELGLMIVHRDAKWDCKDNADADQRNRKLIDGFVKAHPEYKEAFGFLVARIMRPGEDNGYGTVFSAKTGYDVAKEDSEAMQK